MRRFLPVAATVSLWSIFVLVPGPIACARSADGHENDDATRSHTVVQGRPATVLRARVALDFPGATGFTASSTCTDVGPADGCAGEWTHTSGLKVRVIVLPLPDAHKLDDVILRLRNDVKGRGGVVDDIAQQGQRVVRMLEPRRSDGNAQQPADTVAITYLLPDPDGVALHLVTTVVPLAQQESADAAVRDLLAFAAWVTPS